MMMVTALAGHIYAGHVYVDYELREELTHLSRSLLRFSMNRSSVIGATT